MTNQPPTEIGRPTEESTAVFLVAALFASGCAHYPVNAPLAGTFTNTNRAARQAYGMELMVTSTSNIVLSRLR